MYLRVDGTPYYVGKGSGIRAYAKHRTRGGITYKPPTKERIVIYPALSEADAFETEIALIWYYGRKDLGTGMLRNRSDGGTAPPWQASVESRRKHPDLATENARKNGPLANIGITPEEKIEQGLKGSRIALSRTTSEQRSAWSRSAWSSNPRKRRGTHTRWHVNRGVVKPGCIYCE